METNTYIKPSRIDGLGLFAKRTIRIGEEIIQGEIDFRFVDEWKEYEKKTKVKSFAYFNGYCMVNHSITPNTHRGEGDTIIASVDIKPNEEVTENYNLLPEEENPFKVFDLEKMCFLAKMEIKNSRSKIKL